MPRRFHVVGLDLTEIWTILYLSLPHNPVVDTQALCPDLLEQLDNMPNADHLEEHEKRHAKVTRNAGTWLNYALNQVFYPNYWAETGTIMGLLFQWGGVPSADEELSLALLIISRAAWQSHVDAKARSY